MAKTTKKSGKVRVEIRRGLCIGAAACLAVAPELFSLDEENKAVVRDEQAAQSAPLSVLLDAARACPTAAIRLYDEKGRRIYPPPHRRKRKKPGGGK